MNIAGFQNNEITQAARPRLLLADDSVTIRKVVELTFADEGIDVTSAPDGAAAMTKFVEVQPDIVLVDVGLPGTSGYQICQMIKQDDATKHIPVILLVGSFEPFDQDEAERVRADGFLTKPFQSIRELVARVSELLTPEERGESESVIDLEETQRHIEPGVASLGGESAFESLPNESTSPAITENADIENLYQNSFADTAEIEEFDTVEDLLGDAGLDDELIEASYQRDSDNAGIEEIGASSETPPLTKDFFWTPSVDDSSGDAVRVLENPSGVESSDQSADGDILEGFQPGKGPADDPQATVALAEPTPEYIALVAQRVVERLSDRVIREIARDAVPRIAEKLIREALSDEKKA